MSGEKLQTVVWPEFNSRTAASSSDARQINYTFVVAKSRTKHEIGDDAMEARVLEAKALRQESKQSHQHAS